MLRTTFALVCVLVLNVAFSHVQGEKPAPSIRSRPVVACPHPGLWLEPELVCQVNYLDRTRSGRLRGASYHGLLAAPGLSAAVGGAGCGSKIAIKVDEVDFKMELSEIKGVDKIDASQFDRP